MISHKHKKAPIQNSDQREGDKNSHYSKADLYWIPGNTFTMELVTQECRGDLKSSENLSKIVEKTLTTATFQKETALCSFQLCCQLYRPSPIWHSNTQSKTTALDPAAEHALNVPKWQAAGVSHGLESTVH